MSAVNAVGIKTPMFVIGKAKKKTTRILKNITKFSADINHKERPGWRAFYLKNR